MTEFNTKQGRVLYLALEDSFGRLRGRTRYLGYTDSSASDACEFHVEWPSGDEGVAKLKDWLEQYPDAVMIIIDTLQRFRGGENVRDRNVYAQDYQVISKLKTLADQYSVAIVVVHHTHKGGKDEDVVDKVLGTSGLSGAADTIIHLERVPDSDFAELQVVGRDTGRLIFSLEFIQGAGWVLSGEQDAQEQLNHTQISAQRQALVEIIYVHGAPMPVQEIVAKSGKESNRVRAWLSHLVREGLVTRVGRGKYAVVDKSKSAIEEPDGDSSQSDPVEDVDEAVNANTGVSPFAYLHLHSHHEQQPGTSLYDSTHAADLLCIESEAKQISGGDTPKQKANMQICKYTETEASAFAFLLDPPESGAPVDDDEIDERWMDVEPDPIYGNEAGAQQESGELYPDDSDWQ